MEPTKLEMNCHRHYRLVCLRGSSSSSSSGHGHGYDYGLSFSGTFFVKPLPLSKSYPSHWSLSASSRRPHRPNNGDHHRRRRSRQESFPSSSAFNDDGPPVNHYETLGLTRPASPLDIKAAYRRLARQYHPDVNKDAGAVETFKSIRLAYEILSNETTRKAYDVSLRLRFQETQKGIESRRRYGYSHGQNHYHRNEQFRRGVRNAHSANKNNANNSEYRPSGFYRDDYSFRRDWDFFDYQEAFFEPRNEYRRAWFRKEIRGLLLGTCLVASIWYVLGAHTALTFFVFFIPHGESHSLEYWLASLTAWLIGAERGLALKFGLAVITSLFGEVYNKIIAMFFLALWIGGDLKYVIPLPRGAVMAMTYLCIRRHFPSPYSA